MLWVIENFRLQPFLRKVPENAITNRIAQILVVSEWMQMMCGVDLLKLLQRIILLGHGVILKS